MGRRRWATRVAAVVVVATMSGCYSYVRVESPTPGSTVRIDVPVRSAISGRPDPSEVVSMEGLLVSSGDSLAIEISSLKTIGNFREIRSVDTLRIARSDVGAVSIRNFSKPKTLGLAAVVIAGSTLLAVKVFGLSGGSSGGGSPGGGQTTGAMRVKPILSALWLSLRR